MQLLIFAVAGMVLFLVAYAFGLSGTDAAMIFLAVLLVGATLRAAQPILSWLRP